MLVIAHHFIENSNEFMSISQQSVSSLPSNFKLHSFFPSKDLKTGTCIWEVPSVSDIQNFLDEKLGHVSRNVCYEVYEEASIGLPQKTMEEALA